MPDELVSLQSRRADQDDWRAIAIQFERMDTDGRYRDEVKRRTYGLDTFLPLAANKETEGAPRLMFVRISDRAHILRSEDGDFSPLDTGQASDRPHSLPSRPSERPNQGTSRERPV